MQDTGNEDQVSLQPPVISALPEDGLDLPIAPGRFNTSDFQCSQKLISTIRSTQECKDSSRSDIRASQSQSVAAHSMGRHMKDAEKKEAKRAREAERESRAEQKEQDKQAKAAEKRARGAHATDEIEVCIDSKLMALKHGKAVVAAFDSSDVKYRYGVKTGELNKWSTITWHRDVGVGSTNVQIAYVMVVLTGCQGEDLLRCASNVREMMRTVLETFGPVSLSLLFIGLERHLMAKERADYRSAGSGQLEPTHGFSARQHIYTLLSLHFWAEGIVYRDCKDAAQAAEHVVGTTAAIALQPYKGGEDNVAAFTKKKSGTLASSEGNSDLAGGQRQVFKALAGAVNLGPLSAQAITFKYHSLGIIMQNLTCSIGERICDEVANLQAGARRVGPAAVKRLKWLLTSEDPNAKAI